jgi:hypothetical protein
VSGPPRRIGWSSPRRGGCDLVSRRARGHGSPGADGRVRPASFVRLDHPDAVSIRRAASMFGCGGGGDAEPAVRGPWDPHRQMQRAAVAGPQRRDLPVTFQTAGVPADDSHVFDRNRGPLRLSLIRKLARLPAITLRGPAIARRSLGVSTGAGAPNDSETATPSGLLAPANKALIDAGAVEVGPPSTALQLRRASQVNKQPWREPGRSTRPPSALTVSAGPRPRSAAPRGREWRS